MLRRGIRAGRSVRPRFCDFIGFLVRDMCVKTLLVLIVLLPLASRSGIETSGGEASASLRIFWCGRLVQRADDCKIASF